ncbi:MAG TPA: Asp-tRNA(Asn)/Glu-tRNA(Gln) amidotransferase subunit GatC [Alphaproteobacteria bacterium]
MSLDKATVARIATLARIKVADRDLDKMVGDLQHILSWVEQLNTIDTTGIEPMTSAVEVTLPMRDDVVTDGGYADKILANAPEPVIVGEGGFFTVPKVVE